MGALEQPLCGMNGRGSGARDLQKKPGEEWANGMRVDCIRCFLEDIGCTPAEIERFLSAGHAEGRVERLRILTCRRCVLMEQMHAVQKQIDDLDYLIYQMKLEE